eukprot:9672245-Alexandrium_andersonii.AAC.1
MDGDQGDQNQGMSASGHAAATPVGPVQSKLPPWGHNGPPPPAWAPPLPPPDDEVLLSEPVVAEDPGPSTAAAPGQESRATSA